MIRAISVAAIAGIFGLSAVILAGAASFTETFTGNPSTPQAMDPANFEVIRLGLWQDDPTGAVPAQAQHGPQCESPETNGSVRHAITDYSQFTFQCRDHLMTYVSGEMVATYMTPNNLLDLSSGSGTVKWDVSTLSLSTRDWISVFIQGWDQQEQRILDNQIPGNQANPRNAMQIEQGGIGPAFESGSGMWHIEWYDANRELTALINDGCCGASVNKATPMSAVTRTTFQLDITPGHVRLWLPQFNLTLAEGNMPQVPWSAGLVTFAHHTYSPSKGYNPACEAGMLGPCDVTQGESNTHHWDNFTIAPAIPFTIIKPDHRGTRQGDTFTFAQPAPANALVRFEAWGDDVRVSFDGAPAIAATRTGAYNFGENPSSFIASVPQGTTRARFIVTPSWCCAEVNNPHIFALDGGAPSPTATTSPAPTPTVTQSPSPTATSVPTPTPTVTPTPDTRRYRCQVRQGNSWVTVWDAASAGRSCP